MRKINSLLNIFNQNIKPNPKKIWILMALSIATLQCTNELVFSSLVNTRMKIILKGTYETNNSYDAQPLYTNDSLSSLISGTLSGSELASENASLTQQSQLKYYIDIAEIRMATGRGAPTGGNARDYWSFPARNRNLFCSKVTSNSGRNFNNCSKEDGREKLTALLDNGLEIESSDVPSGVYPHVGIFFRRLIVDPSFSYNSSGNGKTVIRAFFENQAINGVDIENDYQFSPSNLTVPMMFPLENKDLNVRVFEGDEPFVVEIRFFLKNLMMKHVRSVSGGYRTFIGPSDWLYNHDYNGQHSGRLGGHFIMSARSYMPSSVGSIQVNSNLGAYPHYYGVVPAGSAFDPKQGLPLAATRADTGHITNLPEGQYDLYRTCDVKICTSANCDQAGTDGYPETAKACGVNPVSVVAGATASVAGCACP